MGFWDRIFSSGESREKDPEAQVASGLFWCAKLVTEHFWSRLSRRM